MADSIKIRITGDDSSYRKTLSGLGSAARTAVKGLTVASAAVGAAWSAVGVVGVRYNAQIEQLQTSFEVMTGSAEKGAEVLERVRQIASATPFETEGLASTVQLLMNYNLTADEAISSMEMLGDISQGNQDKLSRIAMAYGQMSSAGKVLLEDVKQMTEAGFNPLAEISETTGESMASLYDRISKGTLAVDEITASMVRATSEGGKYFQSMEKQSQTLNGQLSTLKDNAMSLLGDVMTPLTDELRDSLLPMANELLGEFATAFEQGGFDGLLDAITGKVPDLLNAAVDAGNKVITGIAKWLPGAMQQIATVLPNALRSVLDMGPQLVSALFDVVSGLVSDLITMLPELVPMIIDGVGDMLSSVVDGVLGLLRGIEDAIFGGAPLEDALEKAFAVDPDVLASIEVPEISLDGKVDAGAYQESINDAIQEVKDYLAGLEGLTDEERTAIVDAIINGTGVSLLAEALEGYGVPSESIDSIIAKITGAQGRISETIAGLGLSEDATNHLQELIDGGSDTGELREALMAYGLDEGEADSVIDSINNEKASLNAAIQGFGLDATTISALVNAMNGDKSALKAALLILGVDEDDIQPILDSYGEISGSLTARAQGIFSDLAESLTNGIPDENDPAYKEAKAAVQKYFSDMRTKLDEWKTEALADLEESGLTGEAYDTEMQEIIGTYDELAAGIDAAEQNVNAWHEDNVGKATAFVESNLAQLEEYAQQAEALSAQIDVLTNEQFDSSRQRRTLVKAGAVTNTGHQVEAIGLTKAELDERLQDAQAQAALALDDALEEFGNNTEAYAAREREILAELEAQEAAAYDQYSTEISAIIAGIAKSNPELAEALEGYADDIDASQIANSLIKGVNDAISMYGEGGINYDQLIESLGLSDEDMALVAEKMGTTVEALKGQVENALRTESAMQDFTTNTDLLGVAQLGDKIAADIESGAIDLSAIAPALQKAVEEGYLVALENIDWTSEESWFNSMLASLAGSGVEGFSNAMNDGASDAGDAASNMSESAIDSAAATLQTGSPSKRFYQLGQWAGQGLVNGLNNKYGAVYAAARRLAQAAERGARITLKISSPSKVFESLGAFTGEGFIVGYKKSIRDAQRTVRSITGTLISAANFSSFPMRTAAQAAGAGSAYVADSGMDAPLNVGLYISDRKIAEATADASARVSNARSKRLAAGWGHAR